MYNQSLVVFTKASVTVTIGHTNLNKFRYKILCNLSHSVCCMVINENVKIMQLGDNMSLITSLSKQS